MRHAIKPPCRNRAVPQYVGRERPLGRPFQKAPRDKLHAGEDKGRDAARLAARQPPRRVHVKIAVAAMAGRAGLANQRSEEHTSELQSLMRISYAVFCLKK